MAAKAGRGAEQFMLRLPDGMRDRIAEAAKASGRSMNSEIVYRLEQSFNLIDERLMHQVRDEMRLFAERLLREKMIDVSGED